MIITDRCQLSGFSVDDTDFYFSLQQDPDVRQYLGGIPSEDHIKRNIERILKDSDSRYWIVKDKHSLEALGVISLDMSELFDEIEISYEFAPKWWGLGLANEALSEVINYAFNKDKLLKLIAITQSKNTKSVALLKKNGMELVQTKIMFDEEQSIFEMTRETFQKHISEN